MERIAVKRFGVSDLTFFQSYFEKRKEELKGNNKKWSGQKAINLDKNTFIKSFYPNLLNHTSNQNTELLVFGPQGFPPLPSPDQKIGKVQKNWRLHGATIKTPETAPERFDELEPGDLAVIRFIGEDHPEAVRLCLIPATDVLFPKFSPYVGNKFGGLKPLPIEDLVAVLDEPLCPEDHPLRDLLFEDNPDQTPVSPLPAEARQPSRRLPKPSRRQIRNSSEQQQLNGEYGEALVDAYLKSQKDIGTIDDYEWTSREFPTAPWDFKILRGTEEMLVDVKSTSAECNAPFHISRAELETMADVPMYQIFRVHSVQRESGYLTILDGVRELATSVMENAVAKLPAGISSDGWVIDPRTAGLTRVAHGIPLSLP